MKTSMKIREYLDIGAEVAQGITLRLLTGDVFVPVGGGAWFVPTVCGAGKSTAIAHLIIKVADKGVLLLCPTRKDCDRAQQRLAGAGMNAGSVLVLHTESQSYSAYQQQPSLASKYQIVVITSVRLNIDVLAPLLDYNGKQRGYVIFDELPLFSKELYRMDWQRLAAYVEDPKKMKPRSVSAMKTVKAKFMPIANDSTLAMMRENHILQLIHDQFTKLVKRRQKYAELHQYTKDVVGGLSGQSTVLCLDATIDVMYGKARSCPFKMLKSTDKYSSPITFKEFTLPVERWVFTEKAVDKSDVDKVLDVMVDVMARQIDSLGQGEKILFVAWLYLDFKQCDPDGGRITKDHRIDLLAPLSDLLDRKGYGGRYDIIYRGSGDGKGSNAYRDYAAISFLGNWRVSSDSVKTLNRNLGIRCTVADYMTAMMVQNICRLRVRKHSGDPITVFYSNDIDPRLMSSVFNYFKKRSDHPQSITGVPTAHEVVDRPMRFVKDVMTLCEHVPGLLEAISNRDSSFKLDIPLGDMYAWLKKGQMGRSSCKSRCFYTLAQKIKSEFGIELLINSKPVPKR